MQRKEEAKRRAAFEVAQRDEIERQLLHPGTGSSSASGGVSDGGSSALRNCGGGGPARATVLYDDSFPTHAYSLSRRSFTETLGGGDAIPVAAGLGDTDRHLEDGAVESRVLLKDVGEAPTSADAALGDSEVASDEEVDDLWGGEDVEGEVNDPTAASDRRRQGGEKTRACRGDRDQHACSNGRFIVQPSLRAPKLPRRLQESVAEQKRRQKRQRAEEEGDMGM